jgi:hypothetical protein
VCRYIEELNGTPPTQEVVITESGEIPTTAGDASSESEE